MTLSGDEIHWTTARRMAPTAISLVAMLAVGCAGAPPDRENPQQPNRSAQRGLAHRIIHARPHTWPDLGPLAIQAGADFAGPLAEALDDIAVGTSPAGLQLGLGVLGAIGDRDSAEFLANWIAARRPFADEAALALGHLGRALNTDSTRGVLEAAVADQDCATLTRVASAASLLDCGDVGSSLPVLHATLIAGTPYGTESSMSLGLPLNKSRWALERRIVIDAIRRYTGGDDFGLDPESPWPDLAAAADACRDALSRETSK